MGEFRCYVKEGKLEILNAHHYSPSYSPCPLAPPIQPAKLAPSKLASPDNTSRSSSTPSSIINRDKDSDIKRKKRIAKYNVYSVEGRIKASFRNGFRWIKNKCSRIAHGF
ncbi:hypothetical protein ACHQM5_029669 [Ranunculus cassubicifolius]